MSSLRRPGGGIVTSATSPWLRAACVVLVLNVLFSLSLLWQAALPTEPLRDRIGQAFASGELFHVDWPQFDSRRGANQYNDCLILQMITNDDNVASKAFGPILYISDETYTMYCAALFAIVVGEDDLANYISLRYTRYWHGYVPLSAALLQIFNLVDIRQGLKLTVYGTWIVLVLSAGRQRGLLIVAAIVAIVGTLFWAIPYYGQSLSHGPGDAFVILGLAGLLFWRGRLSRPETFIPFCAGYGAGVVYLEFLTGLLPTAAGLLFPFAYLVAISRPSGDMDRSRGLVFAATGLAAFALAGLTTVVVKQALSLIFAYQGAISAFAGNFVYYAGGIHDDARTAVLSKYPYLPRFLLDSPIWRFFVPSGKLLSQVGVLTYGNGPAGLLLCAVSALAWLAAGCLAFFRRQKHLQIDFLAFAAGAAIVLAWVLVFPTHTFIHASFMVRILIVPIALGWAALLWQLFAGEAVRRSAMGTVAQPQASRSEGGA